jgi:hypothetical protein
MTAASNPNAAYQVREATWEIPSRTRRGRTHTVTLHGDTGVMECTCEAGQYNKWCWHRDYVNDGHASKPHVVLVLTPPPPTPATIAASARAAYEARAATLTASRADLWA